ncbi:MAG TPA: tetratricopeptide repeat protein [Bacteroidales bacterium]|nr:tetratricopeptide repeat protein [Bacteroidales bacterium]
MKNNALALILTVVLLTIVAGRVQSQTLQEATDKYNAAASLINTDAEQAVKYLKEAIEISRGLGDEAIELLVIAESQLPAMYMKWGTDLVGKRENAQAIEVFEKAKIAAEQFNDPNNAARAADILSKLYLSQGNNAFRANENEEAIRLLSRSLELEPVNPRAHMLMGLLYRRLEDLEKMALSLDLAIEQASATNDAQTVAQSQNSMRDYLAVLANRALQANRNSEALGHLNRAEKYGVDVQIYYLLAVSYNRLSQWDNAIEAANRALDLEKEIPAQRARIWFEIGTAKREKGEIAAACDAFANAAHGDFEPQATHQRQHVLRCN